MLRMTWEEALRQDFRQCCGCFRWLPIAELTEHTCVYGSKTETERVPRWWCCRDCEKRDENAKVSEELAVDP